MRIIVQYSGGKDSQACLLWACQHWGADKIEAVFCDTGWEHPFTYEHIFKTTEQLGVKLTLVQSDKYENFIDMVDKKSRFPSTNARFCTEELKVKPFINYVLDQVNDHVIVVQGIRADESLNRSKMQQDCRIFKYYFQPYTNNFIKLMAANEIVNNLRRQNKKVPINKLTEIADLDIQLRAGQINNKFYTYRKKDVLNFCKTYADDIYRPVFDWTAQKVIDFIIENGQKPNPLYAKGFTRVGCFPCIMCNHGEVKQIIKYFPSTIDKLREYEQKFETSFFPPDYIPKEFCSKEAITKKGKKVKYPTIDDVVKYINGKNATGDLFEQEAPISCMSVYNGICE
jgi:3'-phosphoadenosine 5'-phosphosulfate sulfotransferase (PAPS reductase)/FAD synthetase